MSLFSKLMIFLIAFFLSAPIAAQDDKGNQKPQTIKERRKELAEKKAKREAEEKKAMEEMKEMHLKAQTRETRKRMKKSMKKSTRTNKQKPGFFMLRWFRRK